MTFSSADLQSSAWDALAEESDTLLVTERLYGRLQGLLRFLGFWAVD